MRASKPSCLSTMLSISASDASSSTTSTRPLPKSPDAFTPVRSVAVVVGLVGAFHRDAEIFGLLLSEPGELDAEGVQVEAGNFLVQVLGQHVRSEERRVGKEWVSTFRTRWATYT